MLNALKMLSAIFYLICTSLKYFSSGNWLTEHGEFLFSDC